VLIEGRKPLLARLGWVYERVGRASTLVQELLQAAEVRAAVVALRALMAC